MSIVKKVLPIIVLGIVLTGCASTQNKPVVQEVPSKISFAPAIDVTYAEVTANIEQNIGTDVRWGGQVIESEALDESTVRLTVFAYPLSNHGRPIKTGQVDADGGRFIVDLTDGFAQEANFDGHFVTFYGGVTSLVMLTNGNRQKSFPVINAQELVDWNMVDESSRQYANDRRGNSYYSLGLKTGHFGYPYSFGHSRFGRSHSSFGFFSRGHSSFGNRGFSRFGGSRFGRSRFGRH